MILGGRRSVSVTMSDILFHALLFALAIYAVSYLSRTYNIFEGFKNNKDYDCPTGKTSTSPGLTKDQIKACIKEEREKNSAKVSKKTNTNSIKKPSSKPNKK